MNKIAAMVISLLIAVASVIASEVVVDLPGKPWLLEMDLAGFALEADESTPDGSARKVVFEHKDGWIHLTVVMKPTAATAADTIRDERWQRLQETGPPEVDSTLWTEGERAYIQYFNEMPIADTTLHQKHIHTFMVHDGTRIEVHVSVTRFKDTDQSWLDHFQQSVRIVDRQS